MANRENLEQWADRMMAERVSSSSRAAPLNRTTLQAAAASRQKYEDAVRAHEEKMAQRAEARAAEAAKNAPKQPRFGSYFIDRLISSVTGDEPAPEPKPTGTAYRRPRM